MERMLKIFKFLRILSMAKTVRVSSMELKELTLRVQALK
jgi:hypothetical protein